MRKVGASRQCEIHSTRMRRRSLLMSATMQFGVRKALRTRTRAHAHTCTRAHTRSRARDRKFTAATAAALASRRQRRQRQRPVGSHRMRREPALHQCEYNARFEPFSRLADTIAIVRRYQRDQTPQIRLKRALVLFSIACIRASTCGLPLVCTHSRSEHLSNLRCTHVKRAETCAPTATTSTRRVRAALVERGFAWCCAALTFSCSVRRRKQSD